MRIPNPYARLTEEELDHLLPKNLALLGYRGSISHGTFVPKDDPDSIDDVDLMGFFIASKEHYLGFGRTDVKETFYKEWDTVCYEIRKAFHLLLKNNPNIMSMLWLEPEFMLVYSDVGEQIIKNRDLFVSQEAYYSFLGYAKSQLKRMTHLNQDVLKQLRDYETIFEVLGQDPRATKMDERLSSMILGTTVVAEAPDVPAAWLGLTVRSVKERYEGLKSKYYCGGYMGVKRRELVERHGYDTKNAAHLIRLLRMCEEFLGSGIMNVYRHDANELLQVKQGAWTLKQVQEEALRLEQLCKIAKEKSKLPVKPDRQQVEKLLISILSKYL